MSQLASALCCLHTNKVAHLDIKPENVLINLTTTSTPTLKLIDFGDSVRKNQSIVLPPSNLEFAAPEMVMGQPLNEYTDSWSFGVLLYVFLSGVSPFLDDSIEETTSNILKCDFSFPGEYFSDISNDAKNLLTRLLVLESGSRATMRECQQSSWFLQVRFHFLCILVLLWDVCHRSRHSHLCNKLFNRGVFRNRCEQNCRIVNRNVACFSYRQF